MRDGRVALLFLVTSFGCADRVMGELRIGDDVFAPHDCVNGEEFDFAGVEMWDDTGRSALFGQVAGEAALTLLTPEGVEWLRLDSWVCVEFDGEMRRSSTGRRRGHVSVTCNAASGPSVDGTLSFRACGFSDDDTIWDDPHWDDD